MQRASKEQLSKVIEALSKKIKVAYVTARLRGEEATKKDLQKMLDVRLRLRRQMDR